MNLKDMLAKQATSATNAAPAAVPAAAPVKLKLNLGFVAKPGAALGNATNGAAQSAAPEQTVSTPLAQSVQATNTQQEPATGEGVAGLDTATPSSPTPSPEQFNHGNLPEKFTGPAVDAFRESIETLRGSFEFPELVANATRNILIGLRENPLFVDILKPEDIGLMVRGLRQSTGMVQTSKVLKKEKTTAKTAERDHISAIVGDLDIDLT